MSPEPDAERLYREPTQRLEGVRPQISVGSWRLIAPLIFLIFGMVYVLVFNTGDYLKQKSLTVPVICALLVIALCFASIDAVRQLHLEIADWRELKERYGLSEWEMSALGMGKWCRLCDRLGIYYTTHHSIVWIDVLLHQFCKPILIPWYEVRSVVGLPDRISIALADGNIFYSGWSERLFALALKNLPAGSVFDQTDLEDDEENDYDNEAVSDTRKEEQ